MKSYSKLQCFLTVFLLCFVNLGYNAQNILGLYEGEICRDGDVKNSSYICRNIKKCPSAMEELNKHIHPKICSYDGKTPIVCCPPEENTPAQITTTTIKPATKRPILKAYSAMENPLSSSVEKYITIKDCYDYNHSMISSYDADVKEFSHMALLGYAEQPDNGSWHCGGSLISNRFVLTAAHCEKIENKYPIYAKWARLGELDYNSEDDDARPTDYKIIERIIHPNYKSPSLYNDIALFKLERDVHFSAQVRPICLNTDNILRPPAVMATGWAIEIGGASSKLLNVGLNTISTEECDNKFKIMPIRHEVLGEGILENSMLCTGMSRNGMVTCLGSGSPIQIQHDGYKCMYSQIGLTSFAQHMCGTTNSPSVFTRVSNYISWIERIVWPKM